MKIKTVKLQNIRSIGSRIAFHFEDGINILIGPNGSGKSNVIDILNIVLHTYLIWHWHQQEEDFGKITYHKQELDGFFDLSQHFDLGDTEQQEIKITLEFSQDDLSNMATIREHIDEIVQKEKDLAGTQNSDIEKVFKPRLSQVSSERLESCSTQSFRFAGSKLQRSLSGGFLQELTEVQALWMSYLNYLEKIKYLIEKCNKEKPDAERLQELKCIFKFFSPNRFHENQQSQISLHGQSKTERYKLNKQKSSKTTSSDIDYATYYFARMYHDLAIENQILTDGSIGTPRKFIEDELVIEARGLLHVLGDYDFSIKTVNRDNNTFRFEMTVGGQEIPFDALSSGEKEIINFAFIIAALDLKDACVLIDEPEVHLHPQWQHRLMGLFDSLHKQRNIQFIMSTHSPAFVNRKTIRDIFRMHKRTNQTQVVPEEKTEEWKSMLEQEKDLIDIITYSNNAKVFFADKVLLVEGVTDEIIFSYLVEKLGKNEKERVEVISVNGKDNFPKYINFLKNFQIMPAIICDLDNLWDGKLLKGQTILDPLKAEMSRLYKGKKGDLDNWLASIKSKTAKTITNKKVGERICIIAQRIAAGETINEEEQNFVCLWAEKCIDKKQVFEELQIQDLYSEKDSSISMVEDICKKIKIPYNERAHCFVHVLRRGSIEDYANNMQHAQSGALNFLKEIQTYIEGESSSNENIEELKEAITAMFAHRYTTPS